MNSMPQEESHFDIHDDRGVMLQAAMIALIVISTSAVFLRLLSRKVAHAGYWVRPSHLVPP